MPAPFAPGTITGGCFCGRVRYALHERLQSLSLCYCVSCRRASGAPSVGWGTLALDKLEIDGAMAIFASSPDVERGFCPTCGTTLTWRSLDETTIDITLASLDDADAVRLDHLAWLDDKVDWAPLDESLPAHRQAPGEDAEAD